MQMATALRPDLNMQVVQQIFDFGGSNLSSPQNINVGSL
jgi:hypothetical protein